MKFICIATVLATIAIVGIDAAPMNQYASQDDFSAYDDSQQKLSKYQSKNRYDSQNNNSGYDDSQSQSMFDSSPDTQQSSDDLSPDEQQLGSLLDIADDQKVPEGLNNFQFGNSKQPSSMGGKFSDSGLGNAYSPPTRGTNLNIMSKSSDENQDDTEEPDYENMEAGFGSSSSPYSTNGPVSSQYDSTSSGNQYDDGEETSADEEFGSFAGLNMYEPSNSAKSNQYDDSEQSSMGGSDYPKVGHQHQSTRQRSSYNQYSQ